MEDWRTKGAFIKLAPAEYILLQKCVRNSLVLSPRFTGEKAPGRIMDRCKTKLENVN